MNLPGLLIEYLFSGTLALPWLLRLLKFDAVQAGRIQEWMIPFAVVGIYVLGMVMDLVAFAVVKPVKWRLRKQAAESAGLSHDPKGGAAADRQLRIMRAAPALAAELGARSSRDRIARGAMINAWISLVVWAQNLSAGQGIAGLVLCVVLTTLWVFHEQRSHLFELQALRVFDEPVVAERP